MSLGTDLGQPWIFWKLLAWKEIGSRESVAVQNPVEFVHGRALRMENVEGTKLFMHMHRMFLGNLHSSSSLQIFYVGRKGYFTSDTLVATWTNVFKSVNVITFCSGECKKLPENRHSLKDLLCYSVFFLLRRCQKYGLLYFCYTRRMEAWCSFFLRKSYSVHLFRTFM